MKVRYEMKRYLSSASRSPALSPLRARPSSYHSPVSDSLSLGPLSPAQHVPGLGISEDSSLTPRCRLQSPLPPLSHDRQSCETETEHPRVAFQYFTQEAIFLHDADREVLGN